MTLEEIYGTIKELAFKDDKGIYLDNEKIALDNSTPNAYIRRNGSRSLTALDACGGLYEVTQPLLFVGAVPGASSTALENATIAGLTNKDNQLESSDIDKQVIAESEGIAIEDLAKFDNVAMVMVTYNEVTTKIFDPTCDYDLECC